MADTPLHTFNYPEIIETLIKKENIHDGIWAIYIEFGFGAGNVGTGLQAGGEIVPGVVIPIRKIGIRKVDPITDKAQIDAARHLFVDASRVNPVIE